ncbi:MAG: glycosyl hydrolase family 76 [Bacteroidales bacterium 36-12]|nr:MAG: glycosyl hydrolase family 76 [Bacteroidales bacterium 36-12]
MRFLKVILGFLCVILLLACEKEDDNIQKPTDDDTENIDWSLAANSSVESLINNYWNSNQKYFNTDNNINFTFQYWPQAHALDVLVDAYIRTDNVVYLNYFDKWFEGVKKKNGNTFYNEYYDDMEWNALALLRTYKVTNDVKYRDAAVQIWNYIVVGWNENAGGGITWKKGMEYSKNACSNGPACILAARLYQEFGDEQYKEWAVNIYNWLKSTLVNTQNGMVYDNINSTTGEINKNWIFTYNQGTYIGSAVELFKIFNEKAYLNDAVLAANYTISSLVENSILKSEGTGDGGLFKGIFVRYFTELIQQPRLDKSDKDKYIVFLKHNAETLWENGTLKPNILFGPNWRVKPSTKNGLTEQLSGAMLIEAAALLQREKIMN